MVRKLLIVLVLMLAGCGAPVYVGDITEATNFCSNHSGILYIEADTKNMKSVICQDNAIKRLNFKE